MIAKTLKGLQRLISRFKPQIERLFGIGNGFVFRVSSGSAAWQFRKNRGVAVSLGIFFDDWTQLHPSV